METTESVNGHGNSYMKYISPPQIPQKYATTHDGHFPNESHHHHYHHHRDTHDHVVIEKIRNFSENTTAHGVRRIFIARNIYTARLWLFGIILCFIILIVQAHHLVMKFNRYEKITSIEVCHYYHFYNF